MSAAIAVPAPSHAQYSFPTKTAVQVRLGAMYSTPLVSDDVSTRAVDDSIPGGRSDRVTLQAGIAPVGSIAVRMPLRTQTQVELSGSVARGTIKGDDSLETWDFGAGTFGTLQIGVGYLWRNLVALRGGVGATKLFTDARGVFTSGNSISPMLEAGASTGFGIGGRVLEFDVRVQSHSFGTATLRENGGSDGNVMRVVAQVGTNVFGGR